MPLIDATAPARVRDDISSAPRRKAAMPKSITLTSAVALAVLLAPSPSRAQVSPHRAHRVSDFHSDYDQQRSAPATLLALGSQVLYLTHDLPAEGLHELWASDGTVAGTHMLRELCPSDSYCDLESWVSMGSFALI